MPLHSYAMQIICLTAYQLDCVKRPCSSLGRLRHCNFVTLHYFNGKCLCYM